MRNLGGHFTLALVGVLAGCGGGGVRPAVTQPVADVGYDFDRVPDEWWQLGDAACPNDSLIEWRGLGTVCVRYDGVEHGPYARWHVNGELAVQGMYVAGRKHGVWLEYYESGRERARTSYQRGIKHGRWTMWSEVGGKELDIRYVRGQVDGAWTLWHDNGQKSWEGTFVAGEMTRAVKTTAAK